MSLSLPSSPAAGALTLSLLLLAPLLAQQEQPPGENASTSATTEDPWIAALGESLFLPETEDDLTFDFFLDDAGEDLALKTALQQSLYQSHLLEASWNALHGRLQKVEARLAQLESDSEAESAARIAATGTPVKQWDEIAPLLKAGHAVHINALLPVTSDLTLESDRALIFGPLGGFLLGDHHVRLDLPILNADNHHIFHRVLLDETYPARWKPGAAGVTGTFGGQPLRDPRWWGLTTSDNPSYASLTQAQTNNDAIAAAALSRPFAGDMIPVIVQLPPGKIPLCRTVRLDGLRCTLRGAGTVALNATRLWCHSEVWRFDESHRIITSHFPQGTVPVIEIGYERQDQGANPDEGFQNGVENLSLTLPLNNQLPVSGIMWESGLQEVSTLRYIGVANHSGYGIGGPDRQHLEHNDPSPASYYPQVNTVVMERLWIASPNRHFPDAIGLCVFGLNFEVRNLTVHHQANGPAIFRRPAIIVGSRTCGRLSQVHIEHNPAPDADSPACILLPDDRQASRMVIDGAFAWLATDVTRATRSETVRIENPRASVTLININHRTGSTNPALRHTTLCVHDVARDRRGGSSFAHGSSKVLALYARQFHADMVNPFRVVTTDPSLR